MLCLCFNINRTQNNNNEQPMNRSQLVVGLKVLSLSHAVMRMNWPHNICGGDAELVGAKEILGSHDVRQRHRWSQYSMSSWGLLGFTGPWAHFVWLCRRKPTFVSLAVVTPPCMQWPAASRSRCDSSQTNRLARNTDKTSVPLAAQRTQTSGRRQVRRMRRTTAQPPAP
jgi:hypothetical protein